MINPASFRMTAHSVVATSADGAFSAWLVTQLLNHTFVPAMLYPPPAQTYVALFTTMPSAAGGGAEVHGDPSYSRMPVPFSAAVVAAPIVANTATVIWPEATGDWGTLIAAGLYDAVAGGNFLAFGPLFADDGSATTIRIQAGDIFLVDPGKLTVGIV